MIHEFAFEPSALARFGALWQAIDQFGVEFGRMISCFPSSWKKLVYEATAACGDVERKAIEVRLLSISEKLIPSGRDFDRAATWRLNVATAHQTRPFHAIVQADNPDNHPFVLTATDLHLQNARWSVQTQKVVPRSATALASCVGGLFQVSSVFLFVDPYYTGDRRFNATIVEMLRLAEFATCASPEFEIHCRADVSRAFLEPELNARLSPLVKVGIVLKFFQWTQKVGGDRLHARYVLTNRGGVRFDFGLDVGRDGETTDVSLLGNDLWRQRYNEFRKRDSASATFDLTDSFTIEGTRDP